MKNGAVKIFFFNDIVIKQYMTGTIFYLQILNFIFENETYPTIEEVRLSFSVICIFICQNDSRKE